MSPALEDLVIKLAKKGLSEELIYIKLSESKKISEIFTLEDIFIMLAKYRTGVALAGHDTGKKVFTRMWGAVVLVIGLSLLSVIFITIFKGSFPSPRFIAVTGFMLFAGFILIFKPHKRFDDLD